MSEKNKGDEPTLEGVTAERDRLKGDLEASTRLVQGVRKALGIDDKADVLVAVGHVIDGIDRDKALRKRLEEALEDALADASSSLPETVSAEENGVRSFGRASDPERFVHVERISFKDDVGYHGVAILRRAQATVARCLDASGKSVGEDAFRLAALPPFGPERTLTIVVEVA